MWRFKAEILKTNFLLPMQTSWFIINPYNYNAVVENSKINNPNDLGTLPTEYYTSYFLGYDADEYDPKYEYSFVPYDYVLAGYYNGYNNGRGTITYYTNPNQTEKTTNYISAKSGEVPIFHYGIIEKSYNIMEILKP